jgi:hypothetical protein
VTPLKIAQRVRLGEPVSEGEPPIMGIKASDVLESFFRDISPPRLESSSVLRKGIARGISEGAFAYASVESPVLGPDGKYQVNRNKVVVGRTLAEDEIDFDSGFIMMPAAVPAEPTVPSGGTSLDETDRVPLPDVRDEPKAIGVGSGAGSETKGSEIVGKSKRVALTFEATRDQVFKAFPAIANLADKSDNGKVRIHIEGSSAAGFDPAWLRNAVDEPLDEADIERTTED